MLEGDAEIPGVTKRKSGPSGTGIRGQRSVVGTLAKNELQNQDRHWSRHAAQYHEVFLDPYASGVENPLWDALSSVPDAEGKTVADLGCGTGPLLPYLVGRFGRVIALDFAPAMLERARERLGAEAAARVTFLQRPMHDLDDLAAQIDVAVAVNSLVMPDVRLIDRTLRAIRTSLRPGGEFLGIVPSIDAISYHTMLLMDQALEQGMEPKEAERFAAIQAERKYYDFTFGRFRFQGLRQKFWQPFEIQYRLSKARFSTVIQSKVLYPWDESILGGDDLAAFPRSWDWFFRAGS
jgi:SAM-dependent methyltransferase